MTFSTDATVRTEGGNAMVVGEDEEEVEQKEKVGGEEGRGGTGKK